MATLDHRSITASHAAVGELGWDPTYHHGTGKYPTRYKLPPKIGRDPMRQLARDYLGMQAEKDDRVFGGLDAALRAGVPDKTNRRFAELLKPFVLSIAGGEAGALRCMSLLTDSIQNNELRNAYYHQMLDEQRHTGMLMNLYRWYLKHFSDSGWNLGPKAAGPHFTSWGSFNIFEQFMTGDPIQASICLQVVIETGFTNTLLVAYPDVGPRNGDFALATVMNSIQSDEIRHINNGYITLLYCLQEPDNVPLLEQDISQMYWCAHAFIDILMGVLFEYGSKDRRPETPSWLEKFDKWMMEDYYRSYVLGLGKLGINISEDLFKRARERVASGLHHAIAIAAWQVWPFNWWKYDYLDDRDFEWFENKYPGWYAQWGRFWEEYRNQDPRERLYARSLTPEQQGPGCWTCQIPAAIPKDRRHRIVDGHTRFYCSPECMWVDESNPGRYIGERSWADHYHGWEYSEIVRDLGYVEPDGKTMIGQPFAEPNGHKPWTLDDLAACGLAVNSYNVHFAQAMGLPYKRPERAKDCDFDALNKFYATVAADDERHRARALAIK